MSRLPTPAGRVVRDRGRAWRRRSPGRAVATDLHLLADFISFHTGWRIRPLRAPRV